MKPPHVEAGGAGGSCVEGAAGRMVPPLHSKSPISQPTRDHWNCLSPSCTHTHTHTHTHINRHTSSKNDDDDENPEDLKEQVGGTLIYTENRQSSTPPGEREGVRVGGRDRDLFVPGIPGIKKRQTCFQ